MKIIIETIPHDQHRYSTVGDYWWEPDGTLQIRISALPDNMAFLVAVHEMVEAWICERRGIKEPDIKAFDEANPDSDDPGTMPEAPYHKEHIFAECLERLVARELGVNWEEYDRTIEGLFSE